MLRKLGLTVTVVLAVALCASAAFAGSTGFEEGLGFDGTTIGSLLSGVVFSTSGGNDWVYGDANSNNYNVIMENAPNTAWGAANYWIQDYCFAWLGPTADWGRIDFTSGDASYFTTGYCSYTDFYLEAYDSSDNLLDTAVGAPNTVANGGTGLGYLTVNAPAGQNIAYVKVHDTGNMWCIDNASTDASRAFGPAVPEPSTLVLLGSVLGPAGLLKLRRRKKA